MNLKHFENKAHRTYWSVHIEAWRRSGLSRSRYCRDHGLNRRTFSSWMIYLMGREEARKHEEYQAELRREQTLKNLEKGRARKQKGLRFGARTDMQSRAVQAFWAMHLEALNWSGMSLRQYAYSLNISRFALQKWRKRLEDGELEIDWRAQLHPSARPRVSTNASTNAPETDLTPKKGASRRAARRFFSDEQKLAIALESDQPGAKVSTVARKHGIVTGLLFRWRVEFGIGQKVRARLVTVRVPKGLSLPMELVQPPAGMMAMTLADGARVFVPEGSDPDAVQLELAGKEASS